MSVLLMKLRGVPEDELAELLSMMEAAGLSCYQTGAGNWGISMHGLWLQDDSRYDEARALLDDYQQRRARHARHVWVSARKEGRARGWLDIFCENPLRFLLYMAAVILLVYVSIVPWFGFGGFHE